MTGYPRVSDSRDPRTAVRHNHPSGLMQIQLTDLTVHAEGARKFNACEVT